MLRYSITRQSTGRVTRLNLKTGGLLPGLVVFVAVLLAKPIGASTQFVILHALIGETVAPGVITATEDGHTSANAHLAKSGGKYAANAADPPNCSFTCVIAMIVGAGLRDGAKLLLRAVPASDHDGLTGSRGDTLGIVMGRHDIVVPCILPERLLGRGGATAPPQ